jgi:hypothetical protein
LPCHLLIATTSQNTYKALARVAQASGVHGSSLIATTAIATAQRRSEKYSGSSYTMARLVPAAFSILTWNIYFAPNQWAIRMRHILAECERLQPDVLCLQEVLPPFLALLQDEEKTTELMSSFTNDDNDSGRNSWLARNDYMCSTLDSAEIAPYGVLTMVKRKHRPRFQSLDLPSRMGRRLLLTHLEYEGWGVEGGEGGRKEGVIEEWTIGNVHLESLDSVGLRVEQLRKAGVSLSVEGDRIKNVVLCGDFK